MLGVADNLSAPLRIQIEFGGAFSSALIGIAGAIAVAVAICREAGYYFHSSLSLSSTTIRPARTSISSGPILSFTYHKHPAFSPPPPSTRQVNHVSRLVLAVFFWQRVVSYAGLISFGRTGLLLL